VAALHACFAEMVVEQPDTHLAGVGVTG
jgi:hypothetical protein